MLTESLHSLWIECDSALAVHILFGLSVILLWQCIFFPVDLSGALAFILVEWSNCCTILSSMQIRSSRINREGN